MIIKELKQKKDEIDNSFKKGFKRLSLCRTKDLLTRKEWSSKRQQTTK